MKKIITKCVLFLFSLLVVLLLVLKFCPDLLWIDENDGEVHALLYFFSGVATAAIFFGSWSQLKTINLKNKADFLLEIDRRWCSKEITAVRVELWEKYVRANGSADRVGCHVLKLAARAEENFKKDLEHLFQHLNFLELLGTIGAGEYLDDEDLTTIFGGQLKKYLEFYRSYFNNYKLKKSNAAKLLEKLDKLEKNKK